MTQKAKFNLCKNQIYISKAFKSVLRFYFKIKFLKFFSITFVFVHLHKALAILSILFQSHLTRNLITQKTYKDIQKSLREHSGTYTLRGHSDLIRSSPENTWALRGHSEVIQRSLGELLGTEALKALSYFGTGSALRHSSTRALKALRHLSTWMLRALRQWGNWTLKAAGH